MNAIQVASLYGVLDLKDNLTPSLETARGKIREFGDFTRGAFQGAMVLGAVGLGALATGFGIALNEAMDAQVNIKKLEAVIKSTGGVAGVTSKDALDLADALSEVTRFSDDTILKGETMLLTFTNIGKDVFPDATEAVLNMAEMMGGDLQQAAIQIGKALNDPIQGVTALRRVGVQLTDAQEEQIKKFMELGDIVSAQKIILGELNTEFGGLARAAGDTLSGKLTIFKNKLLNVAEAAGMKALPALENLFTKTLIPAVKPIGDLIDAFQYLFMVIATGDTRGLVPLETLGAIFGRHVWDVLDFVESLHGVISTLKSLVTDVILPFVSDHSKAFIGAFAAIGAVLAGAALIGGIQALIGVLGLLLASISPIMVAVGLLGAAWAEDWLGIRTYITDTVWPAIEPILSAMVEWLEEKIPAAVDALETAFNAISDAFDTGGLEGVGQLIYDSIAEGIPDVLPWVKFNIVYPIVGSLHEIDWGAYNLGLLYGRLLEAILAGASDLKTWAVNYFLGPFADALSDGIDDPVAALKFALIGPYILAKIAEGLFITIPLWVVEHILIPMGAGILDGLGLPDVSDKFTASAQKILDTLKTGFGDVKQWAYDTLIKPIIDAVSDAPGVIGDLLGLGGGGSGLNRNAPQNPSPSGNSAWAQTFDSGGRGYPGMPAFIGTGAQPELFIPDSAGTFYPRGKYPAGVGGGGTQIIQLQLDGQTIYEVVVSENMRRNAGGVLA